jgi:calcineurin-like phosphoesterase family protein
MQVWDRSHHGAFHCHGHSHASLPEDPVARSMDVGGDTNNFYPYHWTEAKDKLLKKPGYLIRHKG